MTIPFVVDNGRHHLTDALNELLAATKGRLLDVATAYFAISGYPRGDGTPSEARGSTQPGCGSLFRRILSWMTGGVQAGQRNSPITPSAHASVRLYELQSYTSSIPHNQARCTAFLLPGGSVCESRHYGGSIDVKSRLGHGAQFEIRLPTVRLEETQEADQDDTGG